MSFAKFIEIYCIASVGSHRIEQVNEVIKEELGKILLEEIEVKPGNLLTITGVATSEDMISAEVFVSVYPREETVGVLRELAGKAGFLQHLLNKQLNMRPVPKIRFVEDERVREADKIENLLEEAKKEGV